MSKNGGVVGWKKVTWVFDGHYRPKRVRGLRTGKREGAQRTHRALLAPAHKQTTGRWFAQTAKRSRGGEVGRERERERERERASGRQA